MFELHSMRPKFDVCIRNRRKITIRQRLRPAQYNSIVNTISILNVLHNITKQ